MLSINLGAGRSSARNIKVKKVRLVSLVDRNFDGVTHIQNALDNVGVKAEIVNIQGRWLFRPSELRIIRAEISNRRSDTFTIFNPLSTELFLDQPDLTISFSAYKRWYDRQRIRVVPHMWTPILPPANVEILKWTNKPPARVGFMGRTYRYSLATRWPRYTPKIVRDWIVAGDVLRWPGVVAEMNRAFGFSAKAFMAFPRLEAVSILSTYSDGPSDLAVEIIDRVGFSGAREEMSAYSKHLFESTYVLCPRGTENYSYRMYEALSFGRIPVIIDTDMVFPSEIAWQDLALIVPYQSIHKLPQIILEDYCHDGRFFIERQMRAFETMRALRTMAWVQSLAEEIKTKISSAC